MSNVVVVGSLNMDLVVRTKRFPMPGETIAGSDFHLIPGGKGANQAVAAARQGAHVTMIGQVGDDTFGEQLLSGLRQDGVDTGAMRVVQGAPSGVALIDIDEKGENFIIIVPGANGRLSPANVDAAEDAIASADVLVAQLEVPMPAIIRAVEVARSHGTKVIINASPARDLPDELLDKVDYLVVNEVEVALLSGLDQSEPQKAARELTSSTACAVVVTLGDQGAMFSEHGEVTPVPGFQVRVLDTTAAGDAFLGAFAVGIANGKSPYEAIRWANAAGALATTVVGAQPSLPAYERVSEFLSTQAEAGQQLSGKSIVA